jgi:hypothetical protein
MNRVARWTVCCALLLAVSSAWAAPDAFDAGKVHFMAGVKLYNGHDYAAALDEFEASYRANPVPEIFYNIALTERALGLVDRTIDALEHYLAEAPAASAHRSDAASLLASLRRTQAVATAPAPHPAAATPEPPIAVSSPVPVPASVSPSPVAAPAQTFVVQPTSAAARFVRSRQGVAALSLGAVGVAALVTGAALGGRVLALRSDVDASCRAGACDRAEYDRAHAMAVATDVLIPIGAVAIVTAVVLVLTRPRARALAFSPWRNLRDAGVSLAGSF